MKFTLNPELAKQAESSLITEKGAYVGKITCARYFKNDNFTTGIEISFRSNTGLEAKTTLWVFDADGKDTFGAKRWHAILTCLSLREVVGKEELVNIYDFKSKKNVATKSHIYPEVCLKEIGLVFQREEYKNKLGEPKSKLAIVSCFEAATKKTATEILNRVEASYIDKLLQRLEDKKLAPEAPHAPTQGYSAYQAAKNGDGNVSAGEVDLLDDVPF